MKHINYTLDEYKELIETNAISNIEKSGAYGVVLLSSDGKAIKSYKKDEEWEEHIENAIALSDNEVLKNNNVILPTGLVYKESELIGYTMPYINGYNIEEIKNDISLQKQYGSQLLKAYNKALENIKAISEEKIEMKDLRDVNIMFDIDENEFKFIDVDLWKKQKDYTDIRILNNNTFYFKYAVQELLFFIEFGNGMIDGNNNKVNKK